MFSPRQHAYDVSSWFRRASHIWGNRVALSQVGIEVLIRPDLDSEEPNRCSHRKLHSELKLIDLQLQVWAPWARPYYGSLGYPTRSVTESANEGGIPRCSGRRPSPEWPPQIAECDRQISALPTRHCAAVMANYFYITLHFERKVYIYDRLARFLARTRPEHPRAASTSTGSDAFKRDLDRARWTLKALLHL